MVLEILVFLGFQEYRFWLIYVTIMTSHLNNPYMVGHIMFISTQLLLYIVHKPLQDYKLLQTTS